MRLLDLFFRPLDIIRTREFILACLAFKSSRPWRLGAVPDILRSCVARHRESIAFRASDAELWVPGLASFGALRHSLIEKRFGELEPAGFWKES